MTAQRNERELCIRVHCDCPRRRCQGCQQALCRDAIDGDGLCFWCSRERVRSLPAWRKRELSEGKP